MTANTMVKIIKAGLLAGGMWLLILPCAAAQQRSPQSGGDYHPLGVFFDASVMGGLQSSTGIGVSLYNDVVKLQAIAARGADNTRYGGWAFGGKMIANIYSVKLSRWISPDWEFYTTTFGLGAQFLYFTMEKEMDAAPLVMGQLLGQWEIIKADMSYFFPSWQYFKSLSLYAEPGIWFAPSDVDTNDDEKAWRTKFTIGFGLRVSLF